MASNPALRDPVTGRYTRTRRYRARYGRRGRRRRSRSRRGGLALFGAKKILGVRPIFLIALLGVGLWAWSRRQSSPTVPVA